MRRTTISLPEELYEQLRQDAHRAHISMAELIRGRLRRSSIRTHKSTPAQDPILKVAGICRGPVLSEDVDGALFDH